MVWMLNILSFYVVMCLGIRLETSSSGGSGLVAYERFHIIKIGIDRADKQLR